MLLMLNFTMYPTDPRKNLEYRFDIIKRCDKDKALQAYFTEMCRRDPLFYINTFIWTYDPRTENKNLPFVTYEFQNKALKELEAAYNKPEDILIEKSRDMGVSWLTLAWIHHKWRFQDGFNALVGSYIEDLIDSKDDLATHFGRLKSINDMMPKWLMPKGWNPKCQSYMKMINPENNNAVTGQAPTERFSRQGRYSLIWVDEFAFWDRARSAWNSMGDATRCRVVSSTPFGELNKFAELANKSRIKKVTLHWKLHPHKDQTWYEAEKDRRTVEEIAQELDINYKTSLTNRVYPEFCDRNFLEHEPYKPEHPLYISWDFGLDDHTAILWLQRDPSDGTVRIIDSYQKSGFMIDYFVPFVTGEIKTGNYIYSDDELALIAKHKRWQEATHYGDPTGNSKNQTSNNSVIGQLKAHGIYVNTNYQEFDLKTRIHKTKLLIRRLLVDKDQYEFIEAIQGSRYPQRSESSQATGPITKPVHDWTSHFRTALEYFAVNESNVIKKSATVIKPSVDNNLDARYKAFKEKKRKTLSPSYKRAC